MIKNLIFLFIILLTSGCSSSTKAIVSDSLDATPVVTGSVVNPAVFAKGGTLVLGSFKPGTGAAADDQTDQLSAMMVKAVNETLPEDNTHFSLQADDQGADFILEGYIDTYEVKGHLAHLAVDGEIWVRETGEKILLFQTATVINLKTQNPDTVAYQVGVAIAHFIGSHQT